MKLVTTMTIALALTSVCDRAFNHGDLTLKLYANAKDARDWAVQGSDDVADTFTGFRGS